MSSLMFVLAVAKPWTYWMAPPLIAAGLLLLLRALAGCKVLVPRYEWTLHQQWSLDQQRWQRQAQLQQGSLTPLRPNRENAEGELSQAA